MTGTQTLNKAGAGILALTGATLNYTPGINVNAGVLVLDATLSSFSAPITVAAGATVNLAPAAAGTLGVNVNPSGTPLAISGAGQLTKTGAFVLNAYGNFTYTGPTTIQAGSLLLTPNAITNAAPTFSGTSVLNLGAPLVGFGLDNAGATAAISVGSGSVPVACMCFKEINRLVAGFAGAASLRSRGSVLKRRETGYTDKRDAGVRE